MDILVILGLNILLKKSQAHMSLCSGLGVIQVGLESLYSNQNPASIAVLKAARRSFFGKVTRVYRGGLVRRRFG